MSPCYPLRMVLYSLMVQGLCAQHVTLPGLEGLINPSFDGSLRQVTDLQLRRDIAVIEFAQGQMALGSPIRVLETVEPRVVYASFRGAGRLQIAPSLEMERQQLELHAKSPELSLEFSQALLHFSDGSGTGLQELVKAPSGNSGDLQNQFVNRLKQLRKLGLTWHQRLYKALVSEDSSKHALFVVDLNTRKHGWLTFVFDAADPEQLEISKLHTGSKKLDVWTKFPEGGLHPRQVFQDPLGGSEYVIKGYELDVVVDGGEKLSVQAEVSFEQRTEGERALIFALDPNLRVSVVTDQTGQALRFLQPEDPKDDFSLATYLVVARDQPFGTGLQKLRFDYSGKRVVREVGGGNFFCQSFGWYPSSSLGRVSLNDTTFAGRYDFDIVLSVPRKFTAVAVGQMQGKPEKDKEYVRTHWTSEIPLAVAGFAYGDYKVHTEKVGNINVEVYANRQADNVLRRIELAVENSGSYALGSLSPSRLGKTIATEVGNSLRVMEKYFGPYPYSKLAVSNIPYSYGQGWPSLLYLSTLSFMDSTQRNQLGIKDHVQLTDFFRAHETSHQWWGHVVGWKSYHDQWLSEGFAEFSGNLYTGLRRGPQQYDRLVRNNRKSILAKDPHGEVFNDLGAIYAGRRLASSPDYAKTVVRC